MKAEGSEIKHLKNLYEGRKAFWGDLHNHSNSGGRSDGKYTLSQWREAMEKLGMDFAAILDHRHVRHMYLPEWEDGVFVGGTEPGTILSDGKAENNTIHYNMLFENSKALEKLLYNFEEYKFAGAPDGFFEYPQFTYARMREMIEYIKKEGGFFVHPHPKQVMVSQDPLDYWLADETGIEVFYGDMRNSDTEENYKLWCDLLALGKRVWACAGEDGHDYPTTNVLTTIYAEEKKNKYYLKHLRCGDFVCGSVGIKMCIGNCVMGGVCDFGGEKLIVSVADFHKSVFDSTHTYSLKVLDENGEVYEEDIKADEENVFSFDISDGKFYRVEVFDKTENLRIAIGNPIWNNK